MLLKVFEDVWTAIFGIKAEHKSSNEQIDAIHKTVSRMFGRSVNHYQRYLKVDIEDVWGGEAEFWMDFKGVIKHLLMKIYELSFSLGPGDVNTAKKKFEKAGKNDLQKDLLIAEGYLDNVHSLRRNHRMLSKDRDLRELVCLALAYSEKGLI